jgi:hypothetical protein
MFVKLDISNITENVGFSWSIFRLIFFLLRKKNYAPNSYDVPRHLILHGIWLTESLNYKYLSKYFTFMHGMIFKNYLLNINTFKIGCLYQKLKILLEFLSNNTP